MPVKRVFLRTLFIAAAALWPLAAGAARIPWWNPDWPYRRIVQVYARPSGFPGDDVAWFQFNGGNQIKPDGSDIRVLVGRNVLPSKILRVGPGQIVSVAFKVVPNEQNYLVYFGNENAEPLKDDWKIRRGCLLETRKYNGGNPNNWKGMQDVLKRATRVLGRAFVPNIFFGHNPFGPSVNNVNTFTGALNCPKDGQYVFSTTSDDASFLVVDGKQVVSWPGWHGAVRDARHKKAVTLKKGLHELTYYHVQGGGGQYMVAAWQVPGTGKFEVIPPTAFAPVYRAAPRFYQRKGRRGGLADFFPEFAGETLLQGSDNYIIRMKFKNWTSQGLRATSRCEWDFGDGNTTRHISPEHVYFARGTYTVKLWVGNKSNAFEAKVAVDRDWSKGVLDRKMDDIKSYLPLVKDYNWPAMPSPDLRNAVIFFERLGDSGKALELCEVLLDHSRELPDAAREEIALKAAGFLADRGKHAEAAAALLDAALRTNDAPRRVNLLVAAGRIQYEDLRDAKAAQESFGEVVRTHASVGGRPLRNAFIGLGDATRLAKRHEREKAVEATEEVYRKALAVKFENTNLRRDRLLVASDSRAIEDFLRRNELDAAWERLDDWRVRSPLDILYGNWTTMYVKYLIARGKLDSAIDEVALLVDVTPRNSYAPEALTLAAEAWMRKGKSDRARETLNDLKEDYPESAFAGRTDELFDELSKRFAPKRGKKPAKKK